MKGRGARRALLCDDHATVREIVAEMLSDCGYEVVGQATLATEAIAFAESLQPDVIVLDLVLPGMSGLQAIPVLKVLAPHTAVVVFSAFEIYRDAALEAGALTFVDKTDMVGLDEMLRALAAPAHQPTD